MNDTPITDANRLPDFDRGGDVVLADVAAELERELTAVTEQRDRLAEALRECREDSVELLGERDCCNDPADAEKRYQETCDNVTRADEALQSLTNPNEL